MNLNPVTTEYTPPAQILANDHYAVIPGGVTFLKAATLIKAGAPVAKVTASGKWVAYDSTKEDGSQVLRGLAMYDIDASAADTLGSVLYHGAVKESILPVELDATAKAMIPQIYFV